MASSIAVLFFALFSDRGPINGLLATMTNNQNYFEIPGESIYRFFSKTAGVRGLAGFINFLMWYGNTTIILMAGIMGIDTALYEASQIDGANGMQTFRMITLPLLKPILLYVLVTAMIGGIQMFDVPQLLTASSGAPDNTAKTVVMLLNDHLFSKNFGMGGAISVLLFFISGILSFLVFASLRDRKKGGY
jgi:multiple sugar transport system permease protein